MTQAAAQGRAGGGHGRHPQAAHNACNRLPVHATPARSAQNRYVRPEKRTRLGTVFEQPGGYPQKRRTLARYPRLRYAGKACPPTALWRAQLPVAVGQNRVIHRSGRPLLLPLWIYRKKRSNTREKSGRPGRRRSAARAQWRRKGFEDRKGPAQGPPEAPQGRQRPRSGWRSRSSASAARGRLKK